MAEEDDSVRGGSSGIEETFFGNGQKRCSPHLNGRSHHAPVLHDTYPWVSLSAQISSVRLPGVPTTLNGQELAGVDCQIHLWIVLDDGNFRFTAMFTMKRSTTKKVSFELDNGSGTEVS